MRVRMEKHAKPADIPASFFNALACKPAHGVFEPLVPLLMLSVPRFEVYRFQWSMVTMMPQVGVALTGVVVLSVTGWSPGHGLGR